MAPHPGLQAPGALPPPTPPRPGRHWASNCYSLISFRSENLFFLTEQLSGFWIDQVRPCAGRTSNRLVGIGFWVNWITLDPTLHVQTGANDTRILLKLRPAGRSTDAVDLVQFAADPYLSQIKVDLKR
jgi:hypothetical protein